MKQSIKKSNNTFDDLPDILSVHQVRQVLGVGRPAVYKLLGKENGIRCFMVGNAYNIPKACLLEYIQRSCKGGANK